MGGAELVHKFLVGFAVAALMGSLNLDNDRNVALAKPQVPCLFVFGDSLVDNGNNNFLFSFAKANYFPYGIDFLAGPTGRFSNGKTLIDVVAQLLDFDNEILPYTKAVGKDILRGVNYASAAAGIRDETGYHLGARSSFTLQVNNYRSTVIQIVDLIGRENSTAKYLSKCIYSIGLGSNDYLNNYFLPFLYPISSLYTSDQFASLLIQQYSQQLKTLYTFGARKFVLHGLGQIGCVPSILIRNRTDDKTCVAQFNRANEVFNIKLKELVDTLNKQQKDAKYVFIDTSRIFLDIKNSLPSLGFKVTNIACCGVGRDHAVLTCLPFQKPCLNRKEYLFWDAFHPTEAVNIIVARRAFDAQNSSYAHPMDIRSLAQLGT